MGSTYITNAYNKVACLPGLLTFFFSEIQNVQSMSIISLAIKIHTSNFGMSGLWMLFNLTLFIFLPPTICLIKGILQPVLQIKQARCLYLHFTTTHWSIVRMTHKSLIWRFPKLLHATIKNNYVIY